MVHHAVNMLYRRSHFVAFWYPYSRPLLSHWCNFISTISCSTAEDTCTLNCSDCSKIQRSKYSKLWYTQRLQKLFYLHLLSYRLFHADFSSTVRAKFVSLCIKLSIEHSTTCDSRTNLNHVNFGIPFSYRLSHCVAFATPYSATYVTSLAPSHTQQQNTHAHTLEQSWWLFRDWVGYVESLQGLNQWPCVSQWVTNTG